MSKRSIKLFIFFIVLLLLLLILSIVYKVYVQRNKYFDNLVAVDSIKVTDYKDGKVTLEIKPSTKQYKCAITDEKVDIDELSFNSLENGLCTIEIEPAQKYVYFYDKFGIISDALNVSDYSYEVTFDDIYYLPLNSTINMLEHIKYYGDKKIEYVYNDSVLKIEDDVLVTKSSGYSSVAISYNGEIIDEFEVYSTDGIVAMPKTFDYNKKYIACGQYDEETADLMDKILEYRVSQAGYGTRAGAVAAARFLTLEFPYRITYFYENGRVHESSPHRADGEGRYYHLGLFLNKNKYSTLTARAAGPAAWGCKLTNYEPDPLKYVPHTKMPNGLDCSGFVSWAILNGGFDVGDIGAGETSYPHQMTDQGKYTKLTDALINSGVIKVGDLFNLSGHIAILVGQDEENFYIAESLPGLNGLVTKTYSKSKVNKTFTHVVLMDEFYKEDGNLTDMWY